MELHRGAEIPPEKGEKGAGETAAGAGEPRVETEKTHLHFAGKKRKNAQTGDKEEKHGKKPGKVASSPQDGKKVIPQVR